MNNFKNTFRLKTSELSSFPIKEGQTYFDTERGILYRDQNGQRFALANVLKVDDLNTTNQNKLLNSIIISKDTSNDTFETYYVKEDGNVVLLGSGGGGGGTLDHSVLSLFSRSKPNQHPIEAISGLKQKVEVHVGEEEPIERVDTWFDVSAVDEEVAPLTRWEKLASTPIIFSGQVINCNAFSESEPLKFVVVGDSAGEIYRQEFHSDEYGQILGEAIIYISTDYASIASVSFVLEPIAGQNAFSVAYFENTGNININDFTALSIEVYR